MNELKALGVTVADQAELVGGSRPRLSELRQTALAFPTGQRPDHVDIHFCTAVLYRGDAFGPEAWAVAHQGGGLIGQAADRLVSQGDALPG